MEYVRDRGSFDELPFEEILDAFRAAYPRMFEEESAAIDPAFRPA
jgi:hypothetical protein